MDKNTFGAGIFSALESEEEEAEGVQTVSSTTRVLPIGRLDDELSLTDYFPTTAGSISDAESEMSDLDGEDEEESALIKGKGSRKHTTACGNFWYV
jgi:hypothetical protein